MNEYAELSELIGKTLVAVEKKTDCNDDSILFTVDNGDRYVLCHDQDCCEYVYVEDITGSLDMLIGHPILVAEESSNNENPKTESDESFTWTFYKFGTVMGWVDIRWYGSSNGYYSEGVSFHKIDPCSADELENTMKAAFKKEEDFDSLLDKAIDEL